MQKLFSQTDDSEIVRNYAKGVLSSMYNVVFGDIGIPSTWRKVDIAKSIRRYFDGIDRAKSLSPYPS